MKKSLLENALPLIASGLSDKFNVKIVVGGDRARTNGDAIYLPDFEVKTRKEKDAVLGYLSHESAHIAFNSFRGITKEMLKVPFKKALWNIFEDVRVEEAIESKYIGSKGWLEAMINKLVADGRIAGKDAADKPIAVIQSFLLCYSRYHFRKNRVLENALSRSTNALISITGEALVKRLTDCVDAKLGTLKSSKAAYNLGLEIYDILSEYQESESSESGESESEEAVREMLEASDYEVQDFLKAYRNEMEQLSSQSCSSVPMPVAFKPTRIDKEYGLKQKNDAKRTSNFLSAKLQSFVQAFLNVRSKTATSGSRLNNKVLYRGGVGDNRLFKTKQVKKQVDTIVEIMLDSSGSMRDRTYNQTKGFTTNMAIGKQAVSALALALHRISGVTVTASAFPHDFCDGNPIELLSEGEPISKMFDRMINVQQDGYTPSCSALWHSIKKVVSSRKKNKVIFFLTDGYPDDDQVNALRELVQRASQEVSIIGIGVGGDSHVVKEFFPTHVCINDMNELQGKLFDIAKDYIIK